MNTFMNTSHFPLDQQVTLLTIVSSTKEIYCDVLSMEVAHILLGHPSRCDHDVKSYGRLNTYVF